MTKTGLVIAHQGIKILVKEEDGTIKPHTIKRNSDFVVGDLVTLEGTHANLLPRRNILQRQTPYGLQNIASNLDGVGIVVSESPSFSRLFLDQVILTANLQQITPFVVVNKIDTAPSTDLVSYLNHTFGKEGLRIFKVSARENIGIKELEGHIGKTGRCILVGVSGVGKSSILNRIAVDANQKTSATVDKDRHGQHTTTQSILFEIEGGELIDSPGVRDFSPPQIPTQDIASHFVGFKKFLNQPCRFRNCLHSTEPDCVIKNALRQGLISLDRYNLYLELIKSR